MTIRFVTAYKGYHADQIVTLAGAEETRLIGLGLATQNLGLAKSYSPTHLLFDEPPSLLLASLVANSTAACTSGVVTVTATSHGLPASAFSGATFYYPGSATLAAGWYSGYSYVDANTITFLAPLSADFTSESINSGAAFTSEVTLFSTVLAAGSLSDGSIISARFSRQASAVAAAHSTTLKLDTSIIGRYSPSSASPNGVFTIPVAYINGFLNGTLAPEGTATATTYRVACDPAVGNQLNFTAQVAAAGMYQRIAAIKLRIE